MSFSQYFHIISGVLKDPKVIVTTILMILVIAFAKFVANYTKKKRAPRPKKEKAPKSAPKPAAEKKDKDGGDE